MERAQRVARQPCHGGTGNRGDARQQQRFRDALPDDAAPAGAKRQAQREVATPRIGARDQQRRHVQARGREHETAERQQEQQRHPLRAPRFVVPLRAGLDEQARIVGAVGERVLGRHPAVARGRLERGLQRRTHLFGGRARRQPRHHAQPPVARRGAARPIRLEQQEVREGHRDVDGFADLLGAIEARRGHADDGGRDLVHQDGAPDGVGAPVEAALPVPVRQHGDRRRRCHVVGSPDQAAGGRRHADTGVVVARDVLGRDRRLGHALGNHADARERCRREQLGHGRRRRPQPFEDRERERRADLAAGGRIDAALSFAGVAHAAADAVLHAQQHELVGPRDRQRPQQQLVDQAEDRRRRPDPERQRQDRRRW